MSSRKKTHRQQKQVRCVFCNGTPVTKEHIWSDWLTKAGLFPGMESHSFTGLQQRTIISPEGSTAGHARPHFQTRQGSALQRKIQNVCGNCNGGWMSGLVNRAKPFVEHMIRDEATVMSLQDRRDVAGWITLTVIMAEFTHPESAGIPASDREWVRHNKVPPDSWSIFLGRRAGTDWGDWGYHHTGGKLSLVSAEAAAAETQTNIPYQSWQSSTYTLGALVVHAVSWTDPASVEFFRKNWSPPPTVRLWPPPDGLESIENLSWPGSPVLGDDDLDRMVSDFRQDLMPPGKQLPDALEELFSALTINGVAVVPSTRIAKSGSSSGKGLAGSFGVLNQTDKPFYDVKFTAYTMDGLGKPVSDVFGQPNIACLAPKTVWMVSTGFGTFRPLDPVKMLELHIDITFSRQIVGSREKVSFTYLPEMSPKSDWQWVPQL